MKGERMRRQGKFRQSIAADNKRKLLKESAKKGKFLVDKHSNNFFVKSKEEVKAALQEVVFY